jgi:hypothetical protein
MIKGLEISLVKALIWGKKGSRKEKLSFSYCPKNKKK